MSNLRNGRSLPRADRAHRLAQLYGVTADFFFLPPDAPYVVDVESQLDAIEQERRGVPQHRANRSAGSSAGDDEVRRIAEGVADLPPDMRETVAKLVDQLRQVAGRRRLRRHSRS
ncbi:helix-turn-helix domain-containing protein [Streptantibioticus parmotrematis]|uniref:helix-turn-helix domain-containing protein n=1 Tax=Streptantibioticus parmotrematis TaxID=2873249 RepID=UPI0027E03805|nr:helix-turn-helix transcriptional regulator [Streptantibioticus parmotrematis]